MNIQVSTKVCSFGKQVVEKLETEYPQVQHNGRYLYKIARSPMCEYMVNFIHKLKHLPEKYMMNSVLENFTILQVCLTKVEYPHQSLVWYVIAFASQLSVSRICKVKFLAKGLFSINVNYLLYYLHRNR